MAALLIAALIAIARSTPVPGASVGGASVEGAIPAGLQAPSSMGFENATVQPSRGGLAVCVSGIVSVTASTNKAVDFNFPPIHNQSELTNLVVEYLSTANATQSLSTGLPFEISGTYDIAATLCTSGSGAIPKAVQFLTHGGGFDRYYWDFAPGYSYVDVSVAAGYAVFLYDRLGVGESAKPDPVNVVQVAYEIEIAHALAQKLRSGYFGTTFPTVIGVGHSIGSIMTQALTSSYPTLFDATVLTGFGAPSSPVGQAAFFASFNPTIAAENQPYRFSGLPAGYSVVNSAISNQQGFFRSPYFDPAILAQVEAQKGTNTLGELLAVGLQTAEAPKYTRPLAVVNGDADLPMCGGNCSYPIDRQTTVKGTFYPNLSADKFGTYVAPSTGHGLNLHHTAGKAYDWIQAFLKQQGL